MYRHKNMLPIKQSRSSQPSRFHSLKLRIETFILFISIHSEFGPPRTFLLCLAMERDEVEGGIGRPIHHWIVIDSFSLTHTNIPSLSLSHTPLSFSLTHLSLSLPLSHTHTKDVRYRTLTVTLTRRTGRPTNPQTF